MLRCNGPSVFVEATRDVRIESVLMDRHETRIDAVDLATEERRPYRLDRITRASVLAAAANPPEKRR